MRAKIKICRPLARRSSERLAARYGRLVGRYGKRGALLLLGLPLALLIGGSATYAMIALGGGGSSSPNAVNLQSGLIGWWKFNGNAKDNTPYADNGTTTSGSTLTTDREGKANSAYAFSGTAPSYIDMGNSTVFNSPEVTYSAWINPSSVSGMQEIAAKELQYKYRLSGSCVEVLVSLTGSSWGLDHTFCGSITAGSWYNVVTTISSSANLVTVYVNGSSIGSVALGGSITSYNTNPLIVGAYDTSSSEPFHGSIDDMRMYKRALSSTEVAALYKEYNPSLNAASGENGLIGWWKMAGNAKDSTPYANNGTVSNATLTTDREGAANSAYSFNGTSSSITTSYVQTNVTDYTVSAWVNTTSTSIEQAIEQDRGSGTGKSLTLLVGKDGANNGSPGQVNFELDSSSTDIGVHSNVTVNDGKWHHIVGVFSGGGAVTSSQFSIYIDGVQASTSNNSVGSASAPLTGVGGMTIGYHQTWNSHFTGSISDLRIYNRALSANDVSNLYDSYNSQISLYSGTGSGSGVNLTSGLVGEWDFTGNAYDSTPYSDNGTVSGATLTTDRFGNANSAYSFNGTSSSIATSSSTALVGSSAQTICAWIKTSASGGTQEIVRTEGTADDGIELQVNSSGVAEVNADTGAWDNLVTTTYINNGSWHQVCGVVNGTTLDVYVDGAADGSLSGSSNLNMSSPAAVYVGMHPGGGDYANGSIDGVRVYNRALSAAEVQALYNLSY